MNTQYAVLAPNGTLALVLGLLALGVGPGDHVIVPDSTFYGSASAVVMVGAEPIFVDVDPYNYQINPSLIEGAISSRTKAIMPVHMMGTSCDMEWIMKIARQHGLFVIEDACQGIGVSFKGQHVGTFGDIGCFSFFADKTITTGEGGLVVCNNPGTYDRLRLLRNQGRLHSGTFMHESIGYNFRMTEMQCAIGIAQLDRLPEIVERKQLLLERYIAGFSGMDEVNIKTAAPNANMVPFRCLIECDFRDRLNKHMQENGVQPRNFFQPMHCQPIFRERWERRSFDFMVSKHAAESCLCLPIFPQMTSDQQSKVISLVRNFFQ